MRDGGGAKGRPSARHAPPPSATRLLCLPFSNFLGGDPMEIRESRLGVANLQGIFWPIEPASHRLSLPRTDSCHAPSGFLFLGSTLLDAMGWEGGTEGRDGGISPHTHQIMANGRRAKSRDTSVGKNDVERPLIPSPPPLFPFPDKPRRHTGRKRGACLEQKHPHGWPPIGHFGGQGKK